LSDKNSVTGIQTPGLYFAASKNKNHSLFITTAYSIVIKGLLRNLTTRIRQKKYNKAFCYTQDLSGF